MFTFLSPHPTHNSLRAELTAPFILAGSTVVLESRHAMNSFMASSPLSRKAHREFAWHTSALHGEHWGPSWEHNDHRDCKPRGHLWLKSRELIWFIAHLSFALCSLIFRAGCPPRKFPFLCVGVHCPVVCSLQVNAKQLFRFQLLCSLPGPSD